MENEPNTMSLFWALFLTGCFLIGVGIVAYELFKAPYVEIDEEESINECFKEL